MPSHFSQSWVFSYFMPQGALSWFSGNSSKSAKVSSYKLFSEYESFMGISASLNVRPSSWLVSTFQEIICIQKFSLNSLPGILQFKTIIRSESLQNIKNTFSLSLFFMESLYNLKLFKYLNFSLLTHLFTQQNFFFFFLSKFLDV